MGGRRCFGEARWRADGAGAEIVREGDWEVELSCDEENTRGS